MDTEQVNIAFSDNILEDSDTYKHYVARSGHFGTKGLASHLCQVRRMPRSSKMGRITLRSILMNSDEIDISSYIG